ncbi:MAG TPA: BTAD domain-containing putative transcriptional regulator [Gaiellaceae bacterium]
MLEFRLLGPLEIRDGDRVLPPLAPKQRALLAAMLLRAGQFVSKQRLIDDVWGEDAPLTVTNSLENQIWRLRQALGRDVVVTRSPGYVLDVDPEQVDALRLDRLLSRARATTGEEKATTLREALALFSGPPLADLEDEPFARVHAGRLAELELVAREELLAAELDLGRNAELVPELERLVAENPYRERLREQLMLALYRAGRQADALAAYHDARTTLTEELGTEPGEDLQQLQRAILRQDEALRAPPRAEPVSVVATPLPRPSRKTVTVLGWAAAAAGGDDPEALRGRLDRQTESLRAAAERHGGVVEPGTPDALTAVFGAPTALEDHALRAVRAAFELPDGAGGIGVDTGEVLVDPAAQPLAVGRAVELARRLAHAAEPREILLGPQTHWLVRDAVTVEPARVEAIDSTAYRAVALSDEGERRALRLDSPLVGRAREREALRVVFDDAVAAQRCRLITVVGPGGVGKSRLVQAFTQDLSDATAIRGRCVSYGEGAAFRPLIEALGEVEATASAARHAFESLARERPLVAIFEDLHWADPRFLDLLEHVATLSRGASMLILCTARPELFESRPSWSSGSLNASCLALEPLSPEESLELVDNLLGEADLPALVRGHIARSADGNPLFVEELLGMLVDREILRHEGGRWTTSELPTLAVPPTIQALVAARIDRLVDDQRLVLDLASIEGTVFDALRVAGLAPENVDVEAQLVPLIRRELVRPEPGTESRFAFRHQLVRDAVYASVPKRTRAELHERLAELLAASGDEEYHRERAQALRNELGPLPDR